MNGIVVFYIIDGHEFLNDVQPIHLKLLLWDCEDECRYECMWKATESFQNRNWRIPQFHGKVRLI